MNILKFVLPILLSFLIACTTNTDIDKDFPGDALWINDGKALPEYDSLFYLDDPAPMFRKEFISGPETRSAKLIITAAGYYKASINGRRIGYNVLDPAWTDYAKRIYYSEYDISDNLADGENCIGIVLGNGFYNPLPMLMWGGRNIRSELDVGRPAFIARLIITDKKGRKTVIKTGPDWKFSTGPHIRNSVYLGEIYDARKEIEGWDMAGFDDTVWEEAAVSDSPVGELQEAFFPGVQETKIIKPVSISSPSKGIYIADMGVNFTGDFRMRLKGEKGDSVVFRFGERIYDDGTLNPMTTVCGQIKRKGMGGPGAPDIAWQTDTYIFGDNDDISYNPEFTFHTYRYMEISGLDYQPAIEDIEGIFFHSNIENKNNFSCSSELLNRIQEACVRTFKANLVSVQSDCPAREKFGYGGDLNATSETFIYNFDIQSFYRKTIYDWVDAINDSVFIDTAPSVGIRYCGLSWESAFLTTQYYLYLYYNNTDIIRELYKLDQEWMDKAARLHPEGIVESGLGDHESLERVPVELTGTTHYLHCARIMEEFARVMGDKESEENYKLLAEKLTKIIRDTFWEHQYEGEVNNQTLYSTLLYYDILKEDETPGAVDSLVKALAMGPSGHFSTGIFGTKYILEALSKTDNQHRVFDVVNSTEYPGWGHMIDRGATTIWETWKESDNTFSNCHPMFGSVSEWFFRWLAGIRPDPANPGFKKFFINPYIPEDLEFVNCNYHSPQGEIISNWGKTESGDLICNISVPEGSKAAFVIPDPEMRILSIRKKDHAEAIDSTFESGNKRNILFDPGAYVISLRNTQQD